MQLYLGIAPCDLPKAKRWRHGFAHMAYRIGDGSTLLRAREAQPMGGGLLCVSDHMAPDVEDPEAFSAALLRECGRRNGAGVLLDFEGPLRRDLASLTEVLSPALQQEGRQLFVPEHYGTCGKEATVLINTALSGGTLSQRLAEAAETFGGPGRLGLDLERMRMDFTLPAPNGRGKALSSQALQALMEGKQPAVYFSPELGAKYFTYRIGSEFHFVLFDDADTFRQKLRLGKSLGCAAALCLFSEIADLDRLWG